MIYNAFAYPSTAEYVAKSPFTVHALLYGSDELEDVKASCRSIVYIDIKLEWNTHIIETSLPEPFQGRQ